jgi:hypothetical protein
MGRADRAQRGIGSAVRRGKEDQRIGVARTGSSARDADAVH